ncbi:hypothetical protein BH23BAC3_BH23BAC3_27540 [soil metagenome]
MERLIRNVTKKFTNLLPKDQSYFTPEDLRNYDIPEFLIQRIEVEIHKKLNESIVPPHSEWTDMAAVDVKHAWDQFIEAIVTEIRMPASNAASVIKTSVTDVAEMILKPRTAIPSILYGSETTLKKNELKKRVPLITLNTHLAEAIIKYMDRREKDELDIQTCKQIVEKVDDRLTHNYNSKKWAQQLRPLYILTGPKVDSELFRIFFESRGMHSVAHRFDLLIDYLTQSRFIETLNSADEDFEDEIASGSGVASAPADEIAEEIEESKPKRKIPSNSTRINSSKADTEQTADKEKDKSAIKQKSEKEVFPDQDESEPDEQEDTLLTSFQSGLSDTAGDEVEEDEKADLETFNYAGLQDDDEPEKDEEDDEPTLYSLFMEEEDEEDSDEQEWNYFTEPENERTLSEQLFDEEDELDEEVEIGEKKEKIEIAEEPQVDEIDSEDVQAEEVQAEDVKAEVEIDNEFEKIEIIENEEIEKDEEIGDDIKSTEEKSAEPAEPKVGDADEKDVEPEPDVVPDEEEIGETYLFGEKNQFEKEAESSDRPIWQSYLGDEDHIDADDIDEPDYSDFSDMEEDDPIMKLIIEAEKKENVEKLIEWLKKDENRFVKSIFNGSHASYEQALIKLDSFDTWKHAASYIGKEIFARNSVNMYDDDAVDFTDRLQEYFENSNLKKYK